MYNSIRPGKILLDKNGKRVQAHGGSIMFVDGKYYFYGENKEGITGRATGEKCECWHHGVKIYSSDDLYNWNDEGVIMVSDNPSLPYFPSDIMDRPHIIYNEKNKQFVMWAKCTMGLDFGKCFFAVCVSDKINKPFKYVGNVTVEPYTVGDFDFIMDGNKAYVVFEHPHNKMICATLNDDYLNVTQEMSEHIYKKCPPFTREAPAYFERNGRKFLITSGTTGYYPNSTITYEIIDFHGEWKELGITCVDDKNNNSFHAQFSSVFKHPFIKDLYIALGDRWLNDLPIDMPDINDIFYRLFDNTQEPLPKDFCLEKLTDENTSEANYVWLPIKFDEDGIPYIKWVTDWRIQ